MRFVVVLLLSAALLLPSGGAGSISWMVVQQPTLNQQSEQLAAKPCPPAVDACKVVSWNS